MDSQEQEYDGVIDFDVAVRDPNQPLRVRPSDMFDDKLRLKCAEFRDRGMGLICSSSPVGEQTTSDVALPRRCARGRRSSVILSLTLALYAVPIAFGADLRDGIDNYTVESWDERRGLPSGRIWAMTQDAAGYLWLGTDAGLVRFDGVRFVRWTSDNVKSLPEVLIVYALASASDGSLWVGFGSGDGIARIRNGQLERYGASSGIGGGHIQFLLEDRTGAVWAGNRDGVYRFQDGRWRRVTLPSPAPSPAISAYEDRAGSLWISTIGGTFRRMKGKQEFEAVDGRKDGPIKLSEDSTGIMWGTDVREGFVEFGAASRLNSSGHSGYGLELLHDREDTMWLATRGQGLWRVSRDPRSHAPVVRQITMADGLSSNGVRSVFEDRDGNVWVGTESGLHRFTRRKVTPLAGIGFAWAAETTPDGSLWIATTDGLVQLVGQRRRRYGVEEGLPSRIVNALFVDKHGTLWVATQEGVARRIGGRFEVVPIGDVRLPRILSLAADSRGNLWMSERERGAFVWSNGHLTPVTPPSGIPASVANFVYVDRRDRVWMGFGGAVVAVVHPEGQLQIHTLGQQMGSVLSAIYEDRNGAIWVGGTGGLARILGDAVDVVTQPTRLPGYGVSAITEDAEGDLWLGVSTGIVRLSTTEFDRAARDSGHTLSYVSYDASDGLVGMPARLGFPGAIRRPDGTLCFITSRGVDVIDPHGKKDRGTAPVPLIERVTADDRSSLPLTPRALLASGTSRLFFEFAVPNLTSPTKERLRYRLAGVDSDWVDAGVRREAFYSNMRSGSYRFEVARLTDDGPGGDAPTVWEFSIRPMVYETWWFATACVATAALLAWAAWQLRMQQLRRQFALVFAERARLSRELHDTFLQELVGVRFHLDEVAANLAGSAEPARNLILRLRRSIEGSVREARAVVHDLRSASLEGRGLPDILRQAGEETFQGTATCFELTVIGTPRRCAPAIDRQLGRIGHEAIRNAAQHADATRVIVTLEYQERLVRLRVSDNGRGFEPAESTAKASAHYGFLIMTERAEQAGAQLRIETKPGTGTDIEAAIPDAGVM